MRTSKSYSLTPPIILDGKKYWKGWGENKKRKGYFTGNGRVAKGTIEVDYSKFNPDDYLLSWITAVAGVETEKDGHTIVPVHNKFINDNGNAWSSAVLLESYHSFILAENFSEHISIPEYSKGKVLDAVAWVVERQFNGYKEPIPTVFIDTLLATSKKKHPRLVKNILSGVLNACSMGCLLADGLVTMADGTQKEIQDILIGDFILTERGGAGEVTDVHVREVEDEDIYVGDIVGITRGFTLTGEHPVRFASGSKDSIQRGVGERSFWTPHVCGGPESESKFFEIKAQGKYKEKKRDKNKLYVTEAYPKEVWLPSEMVTEEFAELLGILAGESQLISNSKSLNVEGRIRELVENCFRKSTNFSHIECDVVGWLQTSTDTIEFFKKFLLGKKESEKKFAPEVIYWPPKLQRALLRGYFNVSGNFSESEVLRAESRSQDMRDQVYLMLLRNGVVTNRCKVWKNSIDFSNDGSYYIYLVTVGRGYNKEWMCDKVKISDPSFEGRSPTFFAQSFAIRKVRSFQKKKYTGKVYNLTVRDSHTYTHCGVVVHNCDILWSQCSRCGKEIEENYDEPCNHIQDQLGRYYVDSKGIKRRVAELCGLPGVKNSCTFKELSWVSRPAFIWAKLHGFLDYSNHSTGRPLRAFVPISRYRESNKEV